MKIYILLWALCLSTVVHSEDIVIKRIDGQWKQKFHAGKLQTPYSHYFIMIKGKCLDTKGICSKDHKYIGARGWALNEEKAVSALRLIGKRYAFKTNEEFEIKLSVKPKQPPPTNKDQDIYDFQFIAESECIIWKCSLKNLDPSLL